jgi:hypothetical protein
MMLGKYLMIMILSAILLCMVFPFNAYALNVCTELTDETYEDQGMIIYVDDFKDVPENNLVQCTYITSNGDTVSYLPVFIKQQKHPIHFFIPLNAIEVTIRTWEDYSILTGDVKNMIEDSGRIVKSQAGWPKKCVREIPTY